MAELLETTNSKLFYHLTGRFVGLKGGRRMFYNQHVSSERMDTTMNEKYYIAYGSNLNISQMKTRCPNAVVLGTTILKNWELLFKGSMTGSYLTIEACKNSVVPAAIWKVSECDEKALDRYEGYPHFYYKKKIEVQYKGIQTGKTRRITAFAYIMHEGRPIGVPSKLYMETCLEGYDTFHFNKQVLADAYNKCKEVVYERKVY